MADNDSLIDFVAGVSGERYLKVEESFGDGFVRLRISEAERRQAKHDIRSFEDVVVELLRNSRDAHARRIFVANGREGDLRSMTVIDDGVGVPAHLHDRIFEPRVTSKLETMVTDTWGVHGRGMALFSIRENVAVGARRRVRTSTGAWRSRVTSDCNALAERADQSTWPVVEPAEDGGARASSRGPHNIIRRVARVRVRASRGLACTSARPTEIIATLHAQARATLASADLLFCDDVAKLPGVAARRPWRRTPPSSSRSRAASASPVSERTAHRVLGGRAAAARARARRRSPAPRASRRTGSAAPGHLPRPARAEDPPRGPRRSSGASSSARSTSSPSATTCTSRREPKVVVGRDEITRALHAWRRKTEPDVCRYT